jgi:hypothetical protein
MMDLEYVVAAYGVVIGGMVVYAATLWRRLGRARGRDDEAR